MSVGTVNRKQVSLSDTFPISKGRLFGS